MAAFAQTTFVVDGKNPTTGGHVWECNGVQSTPAKVGDAKRDLSIKVKNNDIVCFVVSSGQHAVILENATVEKDKVWEVVASSGTVDTELPMTPLYAAFDRTKARRSAQNTGKLVQIRIKSLAPGMAILFACDPHSRGGTPVGENREMLGAIVLDEGKDTKKLR